MHPKCEFGCTEIVHKVSTQQKSRAKCVIWILWIFQWWFRKSKERTTERSNNNGGKILEYSQPDSRFPFFVGWETSEGYYFTKKELVWHLQFFSPYLHLSMNSFLLWKGFYSIWTWALKRTISFPVGSTFIFIVNWSAGGEHHIIVILPSSAG